MAFGWMACDFTSFSTVFQSYQDDNEKLYAVEPRLRLGIFCLEWGWNPGQLEQ